MDKAVCLSTNDTTESSGYGILVGTYADWFLESRTSQSTDESCSADRRPIGYGQCYVPWRSCTSETCRSLSTGARTSTAHRQDVNAYWADKIAKLMRDQFGIKPKVNTYSYRTPYPPAYDLIPLPNRYKVPDFTKLSGQDDTSIMEHVNRFIIQCGEAANRDELRVRLFSSSLSGSAFTWFISLPPNSVITWADLEKQFHKYFFFGVHENKITDLVRLRQRNDESVESFVQRLRDVKNKCYSTVLDDRQLADLAF